MLYVILLGVDVTRKLFYIIVVAGILVIFITTLFLRGSRQASSIKLEVKGLYIDDSNGYPSIIIDFTANKYGFVFKLFDERGGLIDMKTPIEGATRISLSLTGLKPYITITEPRTYVLKVFYNDREVYSKTINVNGASILAELLECDVEKSTSELKLLSLYIWVKNTGDAPLYLCDVACTPPLEVYINGEKAQFYLSRELLVIRPGEIQVVKISLLPVAIKNPIVNVEIIIGEIKETLTFNLKETLKLE